MSASKQTAFDYIDEKAGVITDVSDKIWDYAELSLREYKSGDLYAKVLKEEGFTVDHPFDNIETAFRASYGSGKPVIGILAEYDALTGLSQVAGSEKREELVADGNGHGCGHNLLGAGSMAAAFAVKKYLEEKGEGSGKVVFYGCPGEEGAATKAFMARDGVFAECDAALTWHPGNVNQVTSGTCNTCIQSEYKFTGVASHAAGAPEKGRSALDAVELMNIGVQFLREHMPDSSRIHYSITDAGGFSECCPAESTGSLHGPLYLGQRCPGTSGTCRQNRACGIHDDGHKDGEKVHRRLLQHSPEQGPGIPDVGKLQ